MARTPGSGSSARRGLLLLIALPVAIAASLIAAAPRPAVASICPPGETPFVEIVYYSGPAHEKMVGDCLDCAGEETCTGKQTAYFVTSPHGCCIPD